MNWALIYCSFGITTTVPKPRFDTCSEITYIMSSVATSDVLNTASQGMLP